MNLYHLSYLQQASEILQTEHKPLAARMGFIAKKVAAKFTVHTRGNDPPKLRRCKACQAPITSADVKVRNKSLMTECSLCGHTRVFDLVKPESRKRSIRRSKSSEVEQLATEVPIVTEVAK